MVPLVLVVSMSPLVALHSSVTVVVVVELGLREFSFFILLILFDVRDCLLSVDSFALLAAIV